MSRTTGRKIGLAVIGLVVVAVIAFGFVPRPVSVESARVDRGPLRATLRAEGKTRVVDRYVVSAPVPGMLQRVDLDVGDDVTAGQTIAALDPLPPNRLDARARAEAEARVESRRAAVDAATAQVDATRA
ncbi:MAG: biotin/lipoyl-binding protein, partial [Planctomycetes bacterium]|nr:biotin/lipoyl-binding protein [Planctomycetota bacterium]